MFVERDPLQAESDPLIHLQGRNPLWNIRINRKRQMEEILHLPFIVEIDLDNFHEVVHGDAVPQHAITSPSRGPPFDCGGRASLYQ